MSPVYEVTFHERLVVTERVNASNAAEAREAVLNGGGERIAEEMDDLKGPTNLRVKLIRRSL